MRLAPLLIIAAGILAICSDAFAVKMRADVTRQNMKAMGFDVQRAQRDDGTVRITIQRDLSKARKFDAESELEVVRGATLEVQGEKGLIVRCSLEPEITATTATYTFTIAPDHIPQSRLVITEIDDYKKRLGREHLIGGGTYFYMELDEVAGGAIAPPDRDPQR